MQGEIKTHLEGNINAFNPIQNMWWSGTSPSCGQNEYYTSKKPFFLPAENGKKRKKCRTSFFILYSPTKHFFFKVETLKIEHQSTFSDLSGLLYKIATRDVW